MPSPSRGASTRTLLDSDGLLGAILLLIAAEGSLLLLWHRRTRRGIGAGPLLTFLGAGASFVVALYFHRRPEGGTVGFGLAMIAALLLHVWHLLLLARR